MAYTDAQIRDATQKTYEHVNATVYGGRLPAWGEFQFEITDSTRTLGAVAHRSVPYFRAYMVVGLKISRRCNTLAALANTVRHEIAHIASLKLDSYAGHGPIWKRHAVLCGAEPVRCNPADLEPSYGDYVLTCLTEGCGKTYLYKKRSKLVEKAIAGNLKAKCSRCNDWSMFSAHRNV